MTSHQWLSLRYFNRPEFVCPCCNDEDMDENFMRRLDAARLVAGVPFSITSGWRCKDHNLTVGGVAESAHTRGSASDIAVPDSSRRFAVVSALLSVGFKRIGIYNGTGHLHVDLDSSKPQGVIWTGGN